MSSIILISTVQPPNLPYSNPGLDMCKKQKVQKNSSNTVKPSVADPGCLSRIPDAIFSIPDPGTEPTTATRGKKFNILLPY
jgi:hypothetical protein